MKVFTWALTALLLASPLSLMAQEPTLASLTEEIAQLKEQQEQYRSESTKVGGYAELHYNAVEGQEPITDLHRFVLLFEKQIGPNIRFQSELELEHAFVQSGEGELELEQAFLEFSLSRETQARAGILLVPLGLINQNHEPNSFMGVERPDFAKVIIPSTFFAEGAGLKGSWGHSWQYQAYFMAPLDASGFSGASGLRGGRQKAYKSRAGSLALATRLQYARPGLRLGWSSYQGNSANEEVKSDARDAGVKLEQVQVSFNALDLDWNTANWSLRAEVAQGSLSNSGLLNQVYGGHVGSSLQGYYLEPAIKLWAQGDSTLKGFVRYESLSPQASVASGSVNDAYQYTRTTSGLNYWPHPQVALKVDMGTKQTAQTGSAAQQEWNLGLGWVF
ncbi:MAG: hypothetical protein RRB13_10435 [bacterium]|nr:hypothetical protein [bacterium]